MSSGPEEEPVSVLQRFEKRLEGLVEGAFAKVFKGVVHPVEILNAMQREAEAHKAILAGGRTLVPNRYVIDLSPYDHSRLAPYAAALAQELAQSQAEFIGEQGWTVYGDVIVEIERGEGLDTGMFRVTAEVYTGGDVAPVQAGAGGGYDPGYGQGPGFPGGAPAGPGGPARNVRLMSSDGRAYPLSIGSTVIGRGDQANLRLPDVGISRRHARLDFDGSQVVLTDLGSTNGTMAGTRITLSEAPISIGRAEDSTLVITDDYASTRHARLVPREGQWYLEDMGSTNGTYLDRGKVTAPTPVPLGVPIRIGRTSLELRP